MRSSRAGWFAAIAMPVAAIAVAVASARLTAGRPGYDPVHSSLSRLGEAGTPGAVALSAAIAAVAAALLAASLSGAAGRAASASVAAAAVLLLLAAAVPVSPGLGASTVFHRACIGACLAALVVAVLLENRVLGGAALALLAAGVGLLIPGFPAGLWERLLFGLLLAWLEVAVVRRLLQASATRSGTSAAN